MVLFLSLMSLWVDPSITSWAWEYLSSMWFYGGLFSPFMWNWKLSRLLSTPFFPVHIYKLLLK